MKAKSHHLHLLEVGIFPFAFEKAEFVTLYSKSPLIREGYVQGPQWMPETEASAEPYVDSAFSVHTHL